MRENILTCAELYGLAPERRKALLPVLAQALELTDYLDSRTHSLPLGQKQRLALLCATLHEPPAVSYTHLAPSRAARCWPVWTKPGPTGCP